MGTIGMVAFNEFMMEQFDISMFHSTMMYWPIYFIIYLVGRIMDTVSSKQ